MQEYFDTIISSEKRLPIIEWRSCISIHKKNSNTRTELRDTYFHHMFHSVWLNKKKYLCTSTRPHELDAKKKQFLNQKVISEPKSNLRIHAAPTDLIYHDPSPHILYTWFKPRLIFFTHGSSLTSYPTTWHKPHHISYLISHMVQTLHIFCDNFFFTLLVGEKHLKMVHKIDHNSKK